MAVSAAAFFDKDGTLVKDIPYNVDPARVVFLPGVWEGLAIFGQAGYRLAIVTNQSGVARGYFTMADLGRLAAFFAEEFGKRGLRLDGFYACPHLPGGAVKEFGVECGCRKPKPGLILRAASELSVDIAASWCIGNVPTDVEAGRAAGCRTVMLGDTGEAAGPQEADLHARDLRAAALLLTGKRAFSRR